MVTSTRTITFQNPQASRLRQQTFASLRVKNLSEWKKVKKWFLSNSRTPKSYGLESHFPHENCDLGWAKPNSPPPRAIPVLIHMEVEAHLKSLATPHGFLHGARLPIFLVFSWDSEGFWTCWRSILNGDVMINKINPPIHGHVNKESGTGTRDGVFTWFKRGIRWETNGLKQRPVARNMYSRTSILYLVPLLMFTIV